MKIAILTDEFPPRSRGGSGMVAWREARALARQGHEIRVFCPHGSGSGGEPFETSACFKDGDRPFGPWQSVWSRRGVARWQEALDAFQPDVVHAHHLTWYFGLPFFEWCVERFPTVVTVHDATWIVPNKVTLDAAGRYHPTSMEALRAYGRAYNPWLGARARSLFQRVQAVMFVSKALHAYYEDQWGPLPNGVVLHNALLLDEWPWQPLSTQEGWRIGYASRIIEDKGWSAFGRFLLALHEQGQRVRGSVIGKSDRLERGLRELPPAARPLIESAGFLSSDAALRAWYAGLSGTFVGSLYLDPYPNTVIESLACGRGVWIGPYTGSTEIVSPEVGHVCSLEELRDPTAYVAGLDIERVVRHWSEASRACRAMFDMAEHLRQLMRIYAA